MGIYYVQFGKDVFEIKLGGEYQDGPTCSCDDPDPRICLHIKIVHYHPEVFYENDRWEAWGWTGNQDDSVYKTVRGTPSSFDVDNIDGSRGEDDASLSDDEPKQENNCLKSVTH
eukprot:g47327.t1